MESVIFVLEGVIFGSLIGVLYKIGKLQEAVNELKRLIEK
jgi:hypothetical protein